MSGPKYAEFLLELRREEMIRERIRQRKREEEARRQQFLDTTREEARQVLTEYSEIVQKLRERLLESLSNEKDIECYAIKSCYREIDLMDFNDIEGYLPDKYEGCEEHLRELERELDKLKASIATIDGRIDELHSENAILEAEIYEKPKPIDLYLDMKGMTELLKYFDAVAGIETADNEANKALISDGAIAADSNEIAETANLVEKAIVANAGEVDKYHVIKEKMLAILQDFEKYSIDEKKARLDTLYTELKFCRITDRMIKAKKISLYEEYCILKDMLGEDVILDIDEFKDSSELERINKTLTEQIEERDKLKYISDSIKEVMEEMGHALVSSDYFPEYNKEKQQYLFGEDGILTVQRSDSGSIMMEVASVDSEELDDSEVVNALRYKEELSECEKQKAVYKMMEFCVQYPDMIEALKNRGIIFEKERRFPAVSAFAKKLTTKDEADMSFSESNGDREIVRKEQLKEAKKKSIEE